MPLTHPNRKKMVLFLSNGHGEDAIAAAILKRIKKNYSSSPIKNQKVEFLTLPLVGKGDAYDKIAARKVYQVEELPSGGFTFQRWGFFFKDIWHGLLGIIWQQIKVLKTVRKEISLVVSVGDFFPFILAIFFLRKPIIYIGTAISVYMRKFYFLERFFLKHFAKVVICRDELTTEYLSKRGINALFLGNPMMDEMEDDNFTFPSSPVIGFLPSSRSDAYGNIMNMLRFIQNLEGYKEEQENLKGEKKRDIHYIFSISEFLDISKIKKIVEEGGWRFEVQQFFPHNFQGAFLYKEKVEKNDSIPSFQQMCMNVSQSEEGKEGSAGKKNKSKVTFICGCFKGVIDVSSLLIGTTGTGCEQAVGLGKVVFILPGKGPHTSKPRLKFYKKLLGGAMIIIGKQECTGKEVLTLLKDREKLFFLGEIGKKIMGPPGGCEKIARLICQSISNRGLYGQQN